MMNRSASLFARVGLGTAEIGNLHRRLTEKEAQATLHAAWRDGIRLFDTAPGYGAGLSELRLGAFLRDCDRDLYVLSTKVGRVFSSELSATRSLFAAPLPFSARFGYDYDSIMRAHEQSILRLGIAQIDMLLVHDLDHRNHGDDLDRHFRDLAESGVRAMTELKRRGDVRMIGIAVNEGAIGTRMLAEGDWDVALLASRYTLLEQPALYDFLPAAAARNVLVVAGGVFNSGILAGGSDSSTTYDYAPAAVGVRQRVKAIEAVCLRHGVPLAAAAMQFVLAHPGIEKILLGISRQERIAEAAALLSRVIPQAFWQDLRESGLVPAAAPMPG